MWAHCNNSLGIFYHCQVCVFSFFRRRSESTPVCRNALYSSFDLTSPLPNTQDSSTLAARWQARWTFRLAIAQPAPPGPLFMDKTRTKPGQTSPNQTGPNHPESNRTKPPPIIPDLTKPAQSRLYQPNQSRLVNQNSRDIVPAHLITTTSTTTRSLHSSGP